MTIGRALESVNRDRTSAGGSIDLHGFMERAHDLIWSVDTSCRIQFLSSSVLRMTGYHPVELVGRSFDSLLGDTDSEAVLSLLQGLIENQPGRDRVAFESRMTRKDGTEFTSHTVAVAVRNSNGVVVRVEGSTRDDETLDARRHGGMSGRESHARELIADAYFRESGTDIYWALTKTLMRIFDCAGAVVGIREVDGSIPCHCSRNSTVPEMRATEVLEPERIPAETIGGRTLVRKNEHVLEPLGLSVQVSLLVPIVQGGELLGLLAVADSKSTCGEEEVALLEFIARELSPLIRATHRTATSVKDASSSSSQGSFNGIIGSHSRMKDVFEEIRSVARVTAPVHIHGETGTGKELVANAVHQIGTDPSSPFIAVNCSALPETLLASELFGHVRGAFSGAFRDKRGRFELAHGGTLFLDEIGEVSHAIQVSLLRVLQEGVIEPVGGEKPIPVDVRIISASNKNLKNLVDSGKIRDDFYYRLCVLPIRLPSLRDRASDITLLADHILESAGRELGREIGLSREASGVLFSYDWPGNVRELQNVLRYSSVKCEGPLIEVEHLPPHLVTPEDNSRVGKKPGRRRKLTAESVRLALEETRGNKVEAARNLGVSRATIYKYLAEIDGQSTNGR